MTNAKIVGTVATVLVVALVVAGLFAVGSPSTARQLRADEQRRQHLSDLHFELANYAAQNDEIPESLEDLNLLNLYGPSYDPRRDPRTGEFFDYTKLSDTKYEICAQFETSSEDAEGYAMYGQFSHDRGRNCYELDATEDLLGGKFPPEMFPRAPGVQPVRPTQEDEAAPTPTGSLEESD